MTGHHEAGVEDQPGGGQGPPVAGDPFLGGAEPGQPGDQADPAVAQPGEVADEVRHRAAVLGAHLVQGGAVWVSRACEVAVGREHPVQEHGRHGMPAEIGHQVPRLGGRGDDHAVDPAFVEELDDLALVNRVVVRIGDEQAVTRVQGGGLHPLEDLREVRIADRRHREADGAGAGRHQ